jgi:NTP pyrophosphatase (non-canonical NTP hydrolase)
MDLTKYQAKAKKTAIYKNQGKNYIYPSLGLAGEIGEVMDKIKKIYRDKNDKISKEDAHSIASDLGDVLWYLSQLATELKLDMSKVAEMNLKKLEERKKSGTLKEHK